MLTRFYCQYGRTPLRCSGMRRPRLFSTRQRLALYELAGGRCDNCGGELGDDWHADHVHAYSKGGATDVINGRALCRSCNLKKGTRDVGSAAEKLADAGD